VNRLFGRLLNLSVNFPFLIAAMDILIFGASGATGHQLVRQAHDKGYDVTAFVRDRNKLRTPEHNVKVVEGNVNDFDAVYDAINPGCVVMSALGAASPLSRDKILINGIHNIVNSMKQKGAKRMVYLSFAGVHASRKQLPFLFRALALPLLANVVADHEAKEHAVKAIDLEWTIVRPALLSNGARTGRILSGESLHPGFRNLLISRADVADFMLRQLSDDTFLRKAPVVGSQV
jgi:putative NADH-flavin reductase